MMTHNYGFSFKYLPVDRLIELLQTLPKDVVITTNDIGNLAVFRFLDEEQETLEQIASISFTHEGQVMEA